MPIFTFIANTFTGLSPKCGCVIVLISYPSYGTSILRLESSRFGYPFVIIRRSYSRNIIRLPPNGGGDGQVKPERRKAERIDYESFLNAYNTEVGDRLPHAVAVNEKRKRRLKKIIPQLKTPNVDGFRAYVRAFVHQAKPFYFGDNDTGWTADFDYLLREDSLTGVREGKFADRGIA